MQAFPEFEPNDPYDPDMSVQEALGLGLIAVIDTDVVGRSYRQQCGYEGPLSPGASIRCTRAEGHSGVHAHVLRWHFSYTDVREASRKLQEQRELLRAEERRLQEERERIVQKSAATMNRITVRAQELAKSAQDLSKEMEKRQKSAEDREWSRVYDSPRSRARDKSAGKIRGPK